MGVPIEIGNEMTTRKSVSRNGKWTVKELEAIKPEWMGDSISDGEGLVGEVRVNKNGVKVSFKYGFKLHGKKVWHYCGIFPDAELTKIREERNNARELVKKGIDPRVKKITDKILNAEAHEEINARDAQRKADSLTVKDMFDVWVAEGVKRKDANKYIIQTFNKYIIPAIGSVEIRKLDDQHLSRIYKKIVADGKCPTAFELSKDVKQMLTWAEKRKPWRSLMVEGNPAELVEINKILPPDFTKVRERVLSIEEIKRLKVALENTTNTYAGASNKYGVERPLKKEVQYAMWLCLSTLCRIGELLMTEWAHVDFKKRTWFIPAANTKKVGKSKQTDHLIYLSDFAYSQFEALKLITGDSKWVFPATHKEEGHVCVKSASKQIGDRQLNFKNRTKKLKFRVENNSLVIGDEKWTPHDLRTTGATIMQKMLDINNSLLVADLCLHHKVVTGSAKHYLFADYEDAMRDAWQRLGNRLEAILNADNVLSIAGVKSSMK